MDRSGAALRDLRTAKTECRALLRARLEGMSSSERSSQSAGICERVRTIDAYRRAETLVLYRPMVTEVDIAGLWEDAVKTGRPVYFPRAEATDRPLRFVRACASTPWCWKDGLFLEPLSDETLTREQASGAVIIVPGLGFSPAGCRIGRGGGLYDRSLAVCPASAGYRVGVAFHQQVLDFIPTGTWDVTMHAVVTVRNTWTGGLPLEGTT